LGQFLEEKISFDIQRHRQCASQCGGSINKLKAIAVQVRVYEMVVQSGYVLQAPQSCGKNVWWYTKF